MTTRGQTAGHPSDRAHAEQIRARVPLNRPIGFVHPGILAEDRERAALWFSAAAIGLPVAILISVIGIIKFCG